MDIQQKQNRPTHPSQIPPSSLFPPTNFNNTSQLQLNQNQPLYQPQSQQRSIVIFRAQTDKNQLQLKGNLEIFDNIIEFTFDNEPIKQQIVIELQYRTIETIGTNDCNLLLFVNSNKDKHQDDNNQYNNAKQEQQQKLQQQQQNQQTTAEQLINLIKTQQKGNFYMRGQCKILLLFMDRNQMQNAYNLISLYIGQDDQGASQYDDDEDMQQMISADNIDEDGNIILVNKMEVSGDEEEDNQDGQDSNQKEDGDADELQQQMGEGQMRNQSLQQKPGNS